MKKPTLVYANFDKDTGISTVTINTAYGQFTGVSKLHPDDIQYASNFTGCEYAEMRANIKYLKAILKDYKARLKSLTDLYNAVHPMRDYCGYSVEAKQIKRAVVEANAKVDEMKERIAAAEAAIPNRIKLVDETRAKLANWTKSDK